MSHEREQLIIKTDDGFSDKKSVLKIENLQHGIVRSKLKKKKKEITLFEEK